MHEPSTWVGKGQLLLAKGEVEQASAAFRIVLDGDRDNVSALLGQVQLIACSGLHSILLILWQACAFPFEKQEHTHILNKNEIE